MDFELNELQKMFREAVREFLNKEVAPLVEEAEEKERFPMQILRRMGALGYLCVRYPAKYGGQELGILEECILTEEFCRISIGVAGAIIVHNGIGSEIIYAHGSEGLKQKYIVPAIKGEKLGAFGLTEPDAGSDASAVKTTAVKKDNGYVLNGTKTFITSGPIADFVLVAAYTDKSKGTRGGISIFVVDKGMPGFSARKLHKLGHRGTETGELTFDNVFVRKEHLIGEEGKGFGYLMETLSGGRIIHSFCSLGIAQAAYDAALDYAKKRVQFGQPIGKFQAISFKLAKMATQLEAAHWLGYRAAYLYDHGKPCNKEASMTKLYSSETAQYITAETMQIFGGYGYVMEATVQRYFRDARLMTITEGTSEIQQLVISREIGL